jgi:hypothetical protein
VCRLLVAANVVPSSPILVTLKKEALSSSETSVLTRVTRRNIPEDGILLVRRLSEDLGVATSHNPIGLHGLIWEWLHPIYYVYHAIGSSLLLPPSAS